MSFKQSSIMHMPLTYRAVMMPRSRPHLDWCILPYGSTDRTAVAFVWSCAAGRTECHTQASDHGILSGWGFLRLHPVESFETLRSQSSFRDTSCCYIRAIVRR